MGGRAHRRGLHRWNDPSRARAIVAAASIAQNSTSHPSPFLTTSVVWQCGQQTGSKTMESDYRGDHLHLASIHRSRTSPGVPPIQVHGEPRERDDQWLGRVKDELRTSFPMATGPLVRATLIHSESTCDIILCGHHAICGSAAKTRG